MIAGRGVRGRSPAPSPHGALAPLAAGRARTGVSERRTGRARGEPVRRGPRVGLAVRHPPGLGGARPRPRRRRRGRRVLLLGPSGQRQVDTPGRARGPAGRRAAPGHRLRRRRHRGGGGRAPARRRARPGRPARRRRGGAAPGPACSCRTRSAQTVLARCGDDVAFGLENHAVPREPRSGPGSTRRCAASRFPYGTRAPDRQAVRWRAAAARARRRARTAARSAAARRALRDARRARRARCCASRSAAVLAATGATCVLVEHRIAGVARARRPRRRARARRRGRARTGHRRRLRRHGADARRPRRVGPGRAPLPGPAPDAAGAGRPDAGEAPVLDGPGRRRPPGAVPGPRRAASGRRGRRPRRSRAGRGDVRARRQRHRQVDARADARRAGAAGRGRGRRARARARRGAAHAAPAPAGARASSSPGSAPSSRSREHQFVAATVADELVGRAAPRRRPRAGDGRARVEELLGAARLGRSPGPTPSRSRAASSGGSRSPPCSPTRPGVLVLDEPTFGQDARTWAELVALLGELVAEGDRGRHRHARRRPGDGARGRRRASARLCGAGTARCPGGRGA